MKFNLLKMHSDHGRRYIFDALSNYIYELGSEDDWNHITPGDLEHTSDLRRDALKMEGMFDGVRKNAKTLIIELTEDCNIRCTYCVFDESDPSERNHNKKSISLKTALAAIDNFLSRVGSDECYLVFYGGEPLLEFSLIKDIVSHCNRIQEKKIKFSFTTNGVSLTSEKFEFLVKNDFFVTVSVDGPDFIHDKRRISKTGKGTFHILKKNLENLRNYDTVYFRKNIEFNSTISSFDDIFDINAFYRNSDLFDKEKVRFAPIISSAVSISKQISQSISDEDLRRSLIDRKPVYLKGIDTKQDSMRLESIEEAFIGRILQKIKHRELGIDASKGKKICIPFANRTYIRVSGDIQFCERIQNYKSLKEITDIEENSKEIYQEFFNFKVNECNKCFAYNFCDMCPASFIENGEFSKKLSEVKCSDFRADFKRAMLAYVNSMEAQEAL